MMHSGKQKRSTKKIVKDRLILFSQAYLQVLLVVANTYFIANHNIKGMAFASFMISYVWTLNVKRISTSTLLDRLIYSFGAMVGGFCGYFIGIYLT